MKNQNKTILAFHIGRGGKFNNAGYLSYIGQKDISYFTDNLFLKFENEDDVLSQIEGKENLEQLFEKCRDEDDFTEFEKRTGLDLGEKVYFKNTGNTVGLSELECMTGIGRIDIDGEYETYYTGYSDYLNIKEAKSVIKSDDFDIISDIFGITYTQAEILCQSKIIEDIIYALNDAQMALGSIDFDTTLTEEFTEVAEDYDGDEDIYDYKGKKYIRAN